MLDYYQTLELIEHFNINSGIRDHCANKCRGVCCHNCAENNPETCHRHEGRRLACSLMVCHRILSCFAKNDQVKYCQVNKLIGQRIEGVNGLRNPWKAKPAVKLFTQFLLSDSEQAQVEDFINNFDYSEYTERYLQRYIEGKWLSVGLIEASRGSKVFYPAVFLDEDPEIYVRFLKYAVPREKWPISVYDLFRELGIEIN